LIKRLVWVLLAAEVVLLACALTRAMSGDLPVLLLAVNSVLLIWGAAQLRRKPSCCR
jgi:hypothetical protein